MDGANEHDTLYSLAVPNRGQVVPMDDLSPVVFHFRKPQQLRDGFQLAGATPAEAGQLQSLAMWLIAEILHKIV